METTAGADATVLVVCRANETRSPLYAAALADAVARRGAPWSVASAGTHARAGLPARDDVRRVARDLGLDLDGHRARRLTPELVVGAGLIVTAERVQRDLVAQLVADAGARTFTAAELTALLVDGPVRGPASPAQVAAAAHARRPYVTVATADLPDPTGRGAAAHGELAAAVPRLVAPLADVLGGPARGAGRAAGGPADRTG